VEVAWAAAVEGPSEAARRRYEDQNEGGVDALTLVMREVIWPMCCAFSGSGIE
jgi:hypothetical protein